MNEKKNFFLYLLAASMGVMIMMTPGFQTSRVHAQVSTPLADHGTCIKCHENLYFLYDTGNWFCIRESPMRCVDCHRGDSSSINKDEAHMSREAHPIINEDISKCRECHPEQCDERVVLFDTVAGISNVRVAVPYQPALLPTVEQPDEMEASAWEVNPAWIAAMEIMTLVLITSLVAAIYFVHRKHHR